PITKLVPYTTLFRSHQQSRRRCNMFVTKHLYQNDDTWKNIPLGNSKETIGSWGCLLTSVTMILNGIGYNETPETVNEKMKKVGGDRKSTRLNSSHVK